jgi:ribonucleoside-diphosphate reductase alpha chain
MSIVNQTVPRALKILGYSSKQVDAIVEYIDVEKSILGAPDLKKEHEAVFACSMGDNAIHYRGHVKMMAAVQPFISGAISKTVNMPEDVTLKTLSRYILMPGKWDLRLLLSTVITVRLHSHSAWLRRRELLLNR